MKELEGFSVRKNKNGFTVARVHYTADPDKRTKEWLEREKQGMPKTAWEREMEINYDELSGTPVFGDFDESKHVARVKFDPQLPLIRGWDFGYRHPACVWVQIDEFDRLVVLDSHIGSDVPLQVFADRIKRLTEEKFKDAHQFEDYCDPAGTQRNDRGEKTSVQILSDMGIYCGYSRSEIMRGILIIQSLLLPRRDGKYGLVISRDCDEIVKSAFKGGYKFAEGREGTAPKEEPCKDGWFDHVMDALRYVVIMKMDVKAGSEDEEDKDAEYERIWASRANSKTGFR